MLENTAIYSVFMLWVVLAGGGGGDHIHIYIYIDTYIYIYIRIFRGIQGCIGFRVSSRIYASAHQLTGAYTYINIHMCIYVYIYTYIHTYTYVYIYIFIYMHMHIFFLDAPSVSNPQVV